MRLILSHHDHRKTYSEWQSGIYNFSNEERLVGMNLYCQEIGKFDCLVNGIPSSEYPTLKRPCLSLLDKK
jgi:dTDP-4-dehydrorhamnose reductase